MDIIFVQKKLKKKVCFMQTRDDQYSAGIVENNVTSLRIGGPWRKTRRSLRSSKKMLEF